MKKIVIVLLMIFSILISLNFNPKKSLANEDLKVDFCLKNIEGKESLIKVGKGSFYNFKYNFIENKGDYKLIISGKGAIEFKIVFKDYKIIFPEKISTFISPFFVLKNLEEDYLMLSLPYNNLYYYEIKNLDNKTYISFNLFLRKKEEIKFNIKKVDSVEESFDEYFKIYKEKERKVNDGGLLVPNTSFTNLRNAGIQNFKVKYRIVDSKDEFATDRIIEASFFGIKNFVIFNPVSLKFENVSSNDITKELYFDDNNLNKLNGITLLTSGLKNKDGEIVSFVKKSDPTYKFESSLDTIFLLNPNPDYLKNKGISSYEITYNKTIFPLNISIQYANKQSELSEEKRGRYIGFAIDFTDVVDIFNFNKNHFGKYPLSYIDGKEAQFYLVNLCNLLEKMSKEKLMLSINPKYYQLSMNSDIIYKEIENLSEIENFPVERVLIRNRPIYFSFKLKKDEINEENLQKIFDFSLFYGIYPTFSKPKDESFSLWDYPEKIKLLLPYINYYEIINQIEKRGFKGKTYASISDGKVLRFGDCPEIYFAIDGKGELKIDKNSLNINGDFEIFEPIQNRKLNFEEKDGYIFLNVLDEKVIKIASKNEVATSNTTVNKRQVKFDMNLIIPIIFLFISLVNIKNGFKLNFNYNFLIIFVFLILFLVKFYLNITSPYFLFLSIGFLTLFSSLFESSFKKVFLNYFSIIFFALSFLYHLLTKSQINNVPPFYPYFDLYYFIVVLFLYLFIFHHFKWRVQFDLVIFLTFFFYIFLTNLLTTPFYTPPIDLNLSIIFIIFSFILVFLSFKDFKKFIVSLIFISLVLLYFFWEKIYFYLLTKNIFLGNDFVSYFITLFFITILLFFFSKLDFKTKPNFIYIIFTIFLILNSLILNDFHLNTPNKFGFFSSISRIIFYIIIIIYFIFFVESMLAKKEE